MEVTLKEALEAAGLKAETVMESGSPAKLVHRVAAEWGADLVVIGRHTDDSILGRLTTHAYAIVRESPCPVLSV